MAKKPIYERVLLKLSGEALGSENQFGIDHASCKKIAEAIGEISKLGVEIGVVLGGGNIFRGTQAKKLGLARIPADQIGMMGTIMNGIVLSKT